jgi:hypothetical protein
VSAAQAVEMARAREGERESEKESEGARGSRNQERQSEMQWKASPGMGHRNVLCCCA